MENKKIEIRFGALSDPLGKQLKLQGFKYNKEKVAVFEKEIDAINQLRFGSHLLTDGMTDKIIPKLYKKIIDHIIKENKLSVVNP